METMKIQVGFRCIADVKRIIPKPKGVRGKCKYMIRMEVGDAFYDDIKTCSAYRRLKSYMKQWETLMSMELVKYRWRTMECLNGGHWYGERADIDCRRMGSR